jgi:hypothetical protein
MRSLSLFRRFFHASERREEAIRRLTRRTLLRFLGVDLSAQTEIDYVGLTKGFTQIIQSREVFPSQDVDVSKGNDKYNHRFEARKLIELSDVVVNTESNCIYVNEGDRYKYLQESSEWPSDRVLIYAEGMKRSGLEVVESAALGLPNTGFYHWLSEDLPSFLLTNAASPKLVYAQSSPLNRWILSKTETSAVTVPKWVSVRSLTFITKGRDLGFIHPQNIEKLRSFALEYENNNKNQKSKIYVSRSKTRRALPSEVLIEKYMETNGFLIVYAEELSFDGQIRIFSNAAVVVGAHGAGLIHALWSENCHLIEISTENINRCFEWQSRVLSNEYNLLTYGIKDSGEDIIKKLSTLIPLL